MNAMIRALNAHEEIRRVQVVLTTVNMLVTTPPLPSPSVTPEFLKGVASGYKMIGLILKLTSISRLKGELEVGAARMSDSSERESGVLAAYNIVISYLERMGF